MLSEFLFYSMLQWKLMLHFPGQCPSCSFSYRNATEWDGKVLPQRVNGWERHNCEFSVVYYSLKNNDCQGYLTAYRVEQNKFVWVRKHNRVISEAQDSKGEHVPNLVSYCVLCAYKNNGNKYIKRSIVVISEELEFWCCIIFL